jgi:hypothetical protein
MPLTFALPNVVFVDMSNSNVGHYANDWKANIGSLELLSKRPLYDEFCKTYNRINFQNCCANVSYPDSHCSHVYDRLIMHLDLESYLLNIMKGLPSFFLMILNI